MLHGFLYTLMRVRLEVSLVDSVADDKHVIDTDTDKKERHKVVNTGSLTSKEESQAKA